MAMPQVIFDTNVIVAAVRSRRGASAALLAMVGTGRFEINLSVALALEYEEVLKRDGVQATLDGGEADELVAFLCANARRRTIRTRLRPLASDPDDDFVADLAFAFHCDCIVTHNMRDFTPLTAFGVEVVTPGSFLRIMREQP